MPRLNVQGALRAYLEGCLGGVPVRVRVPAERPPLLVTVTRSGGGRPNAHVDAPEVEILVWAPTEAEAEDLAERVGDLMRRPPHALGILRSEELAMRSDFDLRARSPRWYARYSLRTYQPQGE